MFVLRAMRAGRALAAMLTATVEARISRINPGWTMSKKLLEIMAMEMLA